MNITPQQFIEAANAVIEDYGYDFWAEKKDSPNIDANWRRGVYYDPEDGVPACFLGEVFARIPSPDGFPGWTLLDEIPDGGNDMPASQLISEIWEIRDYGITEACQTAQDDNDHGRTWGYIRDEFVERIVEPTGVNPDTEGY